MTLKRHQVITRASILVSALAILGSQAIAEPFKLGVEQRQQAEQQNYDPYPQYPTPQMMPQRAPIQGNVRENQQPPPQPPRRPPIQAGIQQRVALPPNFLGAWNVEGQRTKVEALPEFQAGAEAVFQVRTSNVWNIQGNPGSGYSMSNDAGVQTQIVVDKVEGNTAFIRYQHPVKNTVAQEAIVLSLAPGGGQFQGLERISIVKEGQPPRAKVTYQLVGRRR